MTTPLKICTERLLPRDLNRPQHTTLLNNGRASAIIDFKKLWITGTTLRVLFMEGTAAQKALVEEQANWWTEHANLNFDFSDDEEAEIRITFDTDKGAWSYIGTDALDIPADQATMNLGFLDGGTAAHEFGHAIGLHHEHQNPEGGIEWNEAVVIRDASGPPNNWSEKKIRHNILKKYKADQVRGTEFDPDSIMLYFFPDRWVKNGAGTKANKVLSETDIAFIASEQAYPGRENNEIPEIPVRNMTVTHAEIGSAGEEDLFKFMVTDEGQHTIETGGETDVVMKLFGPDSDTSLIDEDDDGGKGRNSKINADLAAGEYIVQIRHYNTRRGTGAYSIIVSC